MTDDRAKTKTETAKAKSLTEAKAPTSVVSSAAVATSPPEAQQPPAPLPTVPAKVDTPAAPVVASSSAPRKANGLLIHGQRVLIPGLTIVGPGDDPSCKLAPGDYMPRPSHAWIRQTIVHTTKGEWPQTIDETPGKGGFAKNVADYWSSDPTHGGAQLVVDDDGTIWCLCDLALIAAYHATTSNAWSVGIEMYQRANKSVARVTIANTVRLCHFLCDTFDFAYQTTSRKYNGDAIDRMKFNGGPDMVGVFGHRDNAWDFVRKTSSRGQGDPGDEFYTMLRADGAEAFDFEAREDVKVWKQRQRVLNARGAFLVEDGIAGPGTINAMRKQGYARGLDIRQ